MNKKQFNSKLNGVITSALNQRDNIQLLIVAGIEQYAESGRTTYLSDMLSRTVAVKSLPTVTIKDFIKEHTDLKYSKNKAGEHQFLRADKNADKLAVTPSEAWYDWKKAKHNNVAEVDYKKRIKNDVKKAIESGVDKQAIVNALIDGGLTTSDLLKLASTTHLSVAA